MDLLNSEAMKNDSQYYSANTDIVSSLQFDKRVKSRCYRSQFTLNDQVMVAVERREEYRPIENQVTIEVDICLGICDDEESSSSNFIVRLNDMASQNAWVYRMINYDTFVDKDISNSIRDDAMEPNKLYLLTHKLSTRMEDVLSYNDSMTRKESNKSKLKSSTSQFDAPFDTAFTSCTHKNVSVPYEKNIVLRNELLIHTGTPRYEFIKDRTFTSSFNIDLTKTNPKTVLSSANEINIPVQKKSEINKEIYLKKSTTPNYDQINVKFAPHQSVKEETNAVDKKEVLSSKDEVIPFAEETEDEESGRINKTNTLSKYLQYYLPTEKPKEEEFDIRSDVSTCIESSTETESVNGYFEQTLREEGPHQSIAVLDEFNYLSPSDESSSAKDVKDEVDNGVRDVTILDKREIPYFICDESMHLEDIIYQENMVLQVEDMSSSNSLSLHSTEVLKEYAYSKKGNVVFPKLKSIRSSAYQNDLFLPVSVRRLQYEELNRHCTNLGLSIERQPAKMKLITSENYTDIIDSRNATETLASENKENELDKESSISFSSGSMIVKDVLSDENMDYFIKHNNLDVSSLDKNDQHEVDNPLGQVDEESDYEDSEESVQIHSSRGTPENPEDESGSYFSEPEIDATSASSFTTSRNIDSIALKDLTKTPIECGTGKFEKFLEERERRKSEANISSFPVSQISPPSASLSYVDSHSGNRDENSDSSSESRRDNVVVNQVPGDRNSPLTSVSRTSSVSSSVFGTSSDAPFESNLGDTNTVLRRDTKPDTVEPDSESSFSSKDAGGIRPEITPRKNSIQLSKDGLTSSDWSSSSHDSNGTLNREVVPELLTKEPKSKKDIPKDSVETSIERFERFLQERSRKANTFSGGDSKCKEDPDSSSSDFRQRTSKDLILRHGDSIEDIEELLMQQTPNFDSQRSIPLRNKTSIPNTNQNIESALSENESLNDIDLVDNGKDEKIDNHHNVTRHPDSSSYRSSVSSSEEPEGRDDRNEDHEGVQSSSSSHTEATSTDEDPGPVIKRPFNHGFISTVRKPAVVIDAQRQRGNGKSSDTDSSSSSDEVPDTDIVVNQSTGHRDSIQSARGRPDTKEPLRSGLGKRTLSESSSGTDDSSTSSSDGESSHQETKGTGSSQFISNLPVSNQIPASEHSSSSSYTTSSSSDEESEPKKTTSIDRREKFDYSKRDTSIKYQKEEPISKQNSLDFVKSDRTNSLSIDKDEKFDIDQHRRSSSSSCTLSSSSDDNLDDADLEVQDPMSVQLTEGQRRSPLINQSPISNRYSTGSDQVDYKSMDHREKFENGTSADTLKGPKTSGERSPIGQHKVDNFPTKYSNQSNAKDYQSIDHLEKFEDRQKTDTIDRKGKIYPSNGQVSYHSSSDSEFMSDFSGDDSELAKHLSTDHKETFYNPIEDIYPVSDKINGFKTPQTTSRVHPDLKSVEHSEKFVDSTSANTMVNKRPIKSVPIQISYNSSDSRNPLSSSSDEESRGIRNRAIDHREKFDELHRRSLIEGQRKRSKDDEDKLSKSIDHLEKFENSNRVNTIERQKKALGDSGGVIIPRNEDRDNYRSIDHQEKFDYPIGSGAIKCQRKSKVKEPVNDYSSTDSDESIESTDEESDNDGTNQTADIYQEVHVQRITGGNKTTDHKDEPLIPRTTNTITLQRNISDSSSSNYSKSSRNNKGISEEQCMSPEYVNVPVNVPNGGNTVCGEYGRPGSKMSLSELSLSTSSEDSVSFEKEQEKDQPNRRYLTLPSKALARNIPIKEKSKSLDKPVEIAIDSPLSNRGSTIDMVERKYHEFTETWSKNSPVDRKIMKQCSTPNLSKKAPNDSGKVYRNRFTGPLTTRPRPVPSYLSPVNAYPCEESDSEYESSDSVVNDYSADCRADEISTRNGSLQDFVKDLSQHKLYQAPAPVRTPPESSKQKAPRLSKTGVHPVNLNYGAVEDVTDHVRPTSYRRTSDTSVTTDTSYLDQPTLSKRITKTNLAQLDSLSSSSSSSITEPVTKSSNPTVNRTASVSSTSTSSFSDRSDQGENIQRPTLQLQTLAQPAHELRNNNEQVYRERSHMINGSNIYPVRANDNIRRRVPSLSESSEYSSTTDEESSAKEFLETALD